MNIVGGSINQKIDATVAGEVPDTHIAGERAIRGIGREFLGDGDLSVEKWSAGFY
jgi:hypothetical protein